jgi:histidyl-tRNA synthetase
MPTIQAPKGTKDILPAEVWRWQAVERIARDVAQLYHFDEIRTPIFEHSELFHRGVGETSDIVSKETYTFADRESRSLTLRPEGTAGVVRAVIESGLLNDQGARVKVFYIGPNFRYERPQKGRYRQHHQFGVEAFGIAEPEQDVECILLQMDFYRRCGVKDLSLQINSMGDRESKQRYRDRIVEFLTPAASRLGEDSQRRLKENPLRILDSKDPRDQEATRGVPPAIESLSDKSRAHFDRVASLLQQAGVPFEINHNLVELLGGRPTPGVGFGSGLERLLIALEAQGVELADTRRPLVWLVAHGENARDANLQLIRTLRSENIPADMDPTGRSVKAQFKLADRECAAVALITGDDELASGTIVVKDLRNGTQSKIPRDQLIAHLRPLLANT